MKIPKGKYCMNCDFELDIIIDDDWHEPSEVGWCKKYKKDLLTETEPDGDDGLILKCASCKKANK